MPKVTYFINTMAIKLTTRKFKCISATLTLLLQIYFTEVNGSKNINFIYSNAQSNIAPQLYNSWATNSSIKHHIYAANHRMDTRDSASHNSKDHHLNRQPSDSILRPQLALQIYTNPLTSENGGSKSTSFHAQDKLTGAMFILPILDNSQNPQLASRYQQSTELSRRLIQASLGGAPSNKVSPWHYVMDQPSRQVSLPTASYLGSPNNNLIGGSNNRGDYDGGRGSIFSGGSSEAATGRNGNGFTIDAIISIPPQQQEPQQRDSSSQNTSLVSAESPISRVSNSQATVNTEPLAFSMNLNGDEVIINPISKPAHVEEFNNSNNSSVDRMKLLNSELLDDLSNENLSSDSQRFFAKDSQASKQQAIISGALRKHITSDLVGDQQSASEVNSVNLSSRRSDNNENSDDADSDLDHDHPSRNKGAAKSKYKNIEIDIEKDDQILPSLRRLWDDSTSTDSDDNPDEQINSDPQDGQRLNKRPPRSYFRHGVDSYSGVKNSVRPQSKQSKSLFSQRKQGYAQLKDATQRYKSPAFIGKRGKSKFRAVEHFQENISGNKRASKEQGLAPVMINGEDVKKFEQLLESLRSLSLIGVKSTKSELPNKKLRSISMTRNQQEEEEQQYDDVEQAANNKARDESSSVHQRPVKGSIYSSGDLKGTTYQQRSPSTNRLTQSEVATTTMSSADCDRRKRNKLTGHSSGVVRDDDRASSDSSPATIADQDQEQRLNFNESSDESNDDNDEDNQSTEHEEQSSDNHSSLSSPTSSSSTSSSEVTTSEPSESEESGESDMSTNSDQPRALFVRKTILQSYYDKDRKQDLSSKVDDPESIHQSRHNAQNERVTNEDSGSLQRQQKPIQSTTGGQRQESPSQQRQVHDDLSTSNSYLDQRELNDRELHRMSESRKSRIFVPSRHRLGRTLSTLM